MTQSFADHFIPTPAGQLYARAWNSPRIAGAAPIVLIHDSLGCVELWRDFPARLRDATRRTVIAYDRLGFGRSDSRVDSLRCSFVREEAEVYMPCLLRHFAIDRFVPFGHSVGGGMAICCGAILPQACVAIITESAQMFAEDKTLAAIAAAKIQYEDADRFARLTRYHGEKAPWVLRAWTDTWLSPEFRSWSVRQELAQLAAPLLALHGDLDEFGSGSGEHLQTARNLSTAPVTPRLLLNQGHVPHRQNPQMVVELVADFLST
jgi:pimeloyl-ACP methyl ester carboxylesterase